MITVFTPTYNRGEKLKRLYNSLLSQTNNNFEWLIVDDGSTDNTRSIVEKFCTDKFSIRYCEKKNGGKHTAYNLGLEMAKGEYFLCVDSDDWLSKDAINIISKKCSEINVNIFLVYKIDSDGNMLSQYFPEMLERAGILQLAHCYHCTGEFTLIFKTRYARKYPFPVFEEEKFITESVVYDRMFASENAFLIREIITVCEYQKDGLTNNLNEIMKKNPTGYCLYFRQRIDAEYDIEKRIIAIGKYHCFRRLSKSKQSKYDGKYKYLVCLLYPLGWIVYVYYKLMRGF